MNKIQFTVVCDETGKKYKISFKQEMYTLVTIKHVREHVKKAQQQPVPFDLFYNGELLSDSVFCSAYGINNNAVLLMRLQAEQKNQSKFLLNSHVNQSQNKLSLIQTQQDAYVDFKEVLKKSENEIRRYGEQRFNEDDEVLVDQQTIRPNNYIQQFITPTVLNQNQQLKQSAVQNIESQNANLKKQKQNIQEEDQFTVQIARQKPPRQIAKQDQNKMLLSKQNINNNPNIFNSTVNSKVNANINRNEDDFYDQRESLFGQKTIIQNNQEQQQQFQMIQQLQQQINQLQQQIQNQSNDSQLSPSDINQIVESKVNQILKQKLSSLQYEQHVKSQMQNKLQNDNDVKQQQYLRKSPQSQKNDINQKQQQLQQLNNQLRQVVNNQDISLIQPTQTPSMPSVQLQTGLQYAQTPLQLQLQQDVSSNLLQMQQDECDTGDLNQEVDNLEKVVQLLNNQLEIVDQDYNNQQQINKQFEQQINQFNNKYQNNTQYNNKQLFFEFQQKKQKLENATNKFANMQTLRRKLHNQIEDLKGNLRVFIRIRPQSKLEKFENNQFNQICKQLDNQTIQLQVNDQTSNYKFYRVYDERSSQETVFNDVKPLIQSALDGYNVFIGGYGNTGSGKTFTILGDDGDSECVDDNTYSRLGLLPRAIVELFKQLNERKQAFRVELAMVELYCDQLIDLLQKENNEVLSNTSNISSENTTPNQKQKLEIRKDSKNNENYIKNLLWFQSNNSDQIICKLGEGLQKRHMAATAMNDRSSRSHTIVYLKIVQKISSSTIIFADLAGSERVEKTRSSGQRLKEAQFINTSLSALGDVMCALSSKKQFVPYRNNKLTQLLQPGMGGNSKALLFVCLSPLVNCLSESFCSLQFGVRAKAVQNVNVKTLYK